MKSCVCEGSLCVGVTYRRSQCGYEISSSDLSRSQIGYEKTLERLINGKSRVGMKYRRAVY